MLRAGLLVMTLGSLAAAAGWHDAGGAPGARGAESVSVLQGLAASEPAVRAEAACAAGRIGSPGADAAVRSLD